MIKGWFKEWSLFEKIWAMLFLMLNIIVFILSDGTVLSLVVSLLGMVGVLLAIKGKVSNYYSGIFKTSLYAYISYHNGLVSECLLNILFYFPMQFVGIYLWNINRTKDKVSGEDIVVKYLTNKQKLKLLAITIIGIILYSLLINYLGINKTGIDAFPFIISIIGQILMVKCYAEQWICWIVVNILSIVLWLIAISQTQSGDYSMVVMYVAFLVSSIYGYINWLNLIKKQKDVIIK